MQINLFNLELSTRQFKDIKFIEGKQFKLNPKCDLTLISKHEPKDKYQENLLNNLVPDAIIESRKYEKVFGKSFDNKLIYEKLGISVKSPETVAILSLEDSLDLMLQAVCGCDYRSISGKLKNYKEFSRAVLTLDYTLMSELDINELFDLDVKLDLYLYKLGKSAKNEQEFVAKFFADLIKITQEYLFRLAYKIKSEYEENGIKLIINSYGLSSLVFRADKRFDNSITIYEGYQLKFKTLNTFDYLREVSEVYSLWS